VTDVRRVTVIGCDGRPPTAEAAEALADATLVLGGRRHLDAVAHLLAVGVPTVTLGDVYAGIRELSAHLAAGGGPAVVLASGDPGFFGIVGTLSRSLNAGAAPTAAAGTGTAAGTGGATGAAAGTGGGTGSDPGVTVDIEVLPATSSVTLAFARAGLPWTDAAVVSVHGRQLRRAANVCSAHPLVAVLTGPGAGPAALGSALTGLPRRMFVAENLGLPGERVSWCTPEEAAVRSDWREPNIVLAVATGSAFSAFSPRPVASGSTCNGVTFHRPADSGPADPGSVSHGPADSGPAEPGPTFRDPAEPGPMPWMFPRRSSPSTWALVEDAFGHRDSMITKMEVRALVLARLGPGPGDLVWDVGAGSGSVAVECAAFGAAAIAIDRSSEAIGTVAANAAARGVSVQVVHGEAPAVLADLPDPDAVFVGGGGPEVTAACAARGPRVVVAALAAVDRVRPTWEALAAAGMDVGGTQLAASRLRPLPDGRLRLAATNPVTIVWGWRDA
jgi:precorrin-6Y C5,15-methyltransferase (decarboxylating)